MITYIITKGMLSQLTWSTTVRELSTVQTILHGYVCGGDDDDCLPTYRVDHRHVHSRAY